MSKKYEYEVTVYAKSTTGRDEKHEWTAFAESIEHAMADAFMEVRRASECDTSANEHYIANQIEVMPDDDAWDNDSYLVACREATGWYIERYELD